MPGRTRNNAALITERRLELRRLRWQLTNGRVKCDPDRLPFSLECLDREIEALKA
ncbi:hypothetical protein D3C81_755740 [compost metagenome]